MLTAAGGISHAQARGDMRLLRGRRAAHWLWPSFRRPDQALLTPANAPHAFPEPVSCAILSQAVGGWAAHLGNVGSKAMRMVDASIALFARFAGNSRIGDLLSMLA